MADFSGFPEWILHPLVLSLMGSFHCMGMCGGFVMLLGKNHPEKPAYWWYQAGKTAGYAVVGSLVILLSWVVTKQSDTATLQFSFIGIAGLVMIWLAGSELTGKWKFGSLPVGKFLPVGQLSRSPFLFGVMNGLLPCGLVYMLFASLPLGPGAGAQYGMILLFGLGTVPSLWLFKLAGSRIGRSGLAVLEKIMYTYLLIFGILTFMRAFPAGRMFVMNLPDLVRSLLMAN